MPDNSELLTAAKSAGVALRRALLAWYRRHRREFPWRDVSDPYRIWLAEILMQQTRVETGTAYYERFVAACPDVHALATADEETVLKLWEGLGYYARARNLHKAAKQIVAERKGVLPATAAEWQTLPGVGAYTAGAIASIAFGEAVAAVDGNVKRVFARWFNLTDDIDRPATLKQLWQIAAVILSRKSPGDWNQAIMELGARVCLPRNPQCARCPVQRQCQAFLHGVQAERPVRVKKKKSPHKIVVAAVIERGGKWLIGKRRAAGMLGGLWEFPGGAILRDEAHAVALRRIVKDETGLTIKIGAAVGVVEHVYSHFSITLHLYRATRTRGNATAGHYTDVRWVTRRQLDALAMPKSDRKLIAAFL